MQTIFQHKKIFAPFLLFLTFYFIVAPFPLSSFLAQYTYYNWNTTMMSNGVIRHNPLPEEALSGPVPVRMAEFFVGSTGLMPISSLLGEDGMKKYGLLLCGNFFDVGFCLPSALGIFIGLTIILILLLLLNYIVYWLFYKRFHSEITTPPFSKNQFLIPVVFLGSFLLLTATLTAHAFFSGKAVATSIANSNATYGARLRELLQISDFREEPVYSATSSKIIADNVSFKLARNPHANEDDYARRLLTNKSFPEANITVLLIQGYNNYNSPFSLVFNSLGSLNIDNAQPKTFTFRVPVVTDDQLKTMSDFQNIPFYAQIKASLGTGADIVFTGDSSATADQYSTDEPTAYIEGVNIIDETLKTRPYSMSDFR